MARKSKISSQTISDQDALAALVKIERLLHRSEYTARLLSGREFKYRPFAEAYRLVETLRSRFRDADEADA